MARKVRVAEQIRGTYTAALLVEVYDKHEGSAASISTVCGAVVGEVMSRAPLADIEESIEDCRRLLRIKPAGAVKELAGALLDALIEFRQVAAVETEPEQKLQGDLL